ncbi:hypothetical protein DFR34_11377 [Rivihabitans pingtungensis]|uniref:Uncharacterized protein n=1 Tax=Rivihabitans pingtungensis TaxID=1054498 RepID=A0A318KMX3_9NEIS|nr:hypothetical protein DFR34_11377 [Rivihabitans pingtungensis]
MAAVGIGSQMRASPVMLAQTVRDTATASRLGERRLSHGRKV